MLRDGGLDRLCHLTLWRDIRRLVAMATASTSPDFAAQKSPILRFSGRHYRTFVSLMYAHAHLCGPVVLFLSRVRVKTFLAINTEEGTRTALHIFNPDDGNAIIEDEMYPHAQRTFYLCTYNEHDKHSWDSLPYVDIFPLFGEVKRSHATWQLDALFTQARQVSFKKIFHQKFCYTSFQVHILWHKW